MSANSLEKHIKKLKDTISFEMKAGRMGMHCFDGSKRRGHNISEKGEQWYGER